MPTHNPTVVVFEGRPRVVPELERQFAGENVHVRGCRRLGDVAAADGGDCVAVLDFDFAPADCLQFLGRRVGRAPASPTVVVASERTASLEWTVRDLGVLDFIVDVPFGEELSRVCRRHWACVEGAT